MQELSLNELLDSVGINQTILAKLLNVSRSTITRMNDEVTPEVLAVIDKYKSSMTHEQSEDVPVPAIRPARSVVNGEHEYLPVTHRNIALSRTWHHLDNKQVASRFNLSVFGYNKAVRDTMHHCQVNQTSFIELRA